MSRLLRSGVAIAFLLSLIVVGNVRPQVASVFATTASTVPTFGEPTVSGIQGYGFEENLRFDTSSTSPYKGTIYTSAPDSLSSGTSFVWRSIDGGSTFKMIPAAIQPQGKVDTSCVGGGDTELAVDSAGHLFFNDLTLANFSVSRSDDRGVTFPSVSCTGVPDAVVDRQWYATYGDVLNGGHLILAYDRVAQSTPATGPADCTAATASNNVLVLAQSPINATVSPTAGTQFGPSQPISCDEGIMGNDEVYNYTSKSGSTLEAYVIHDNAAFTSVSMGRCDVVPIDPVLSPTGFANCVNIPISKFGPTDNAPGCFHGCKTGGNFPVMAVDRAGRLAAIWEQAPLNSSGQITNSALMFSTSSDRGNTWSKPQQIPLTLPNGLPLKNNWGAWIAAGTAGRFDIAWYGTTTWCGTTCQASGGGPDYLPNSAEWGMYFDQTEDNGATWLSSPILASQHYVHAGNIQSVMGGQNGNRTLGDFMQIRIGGQGEADISYADSNNIAGTTTPHAMFVRQNGGPSVFVGSSGGPTTVMLPAAPVDHASDATGDATYDSNSLSTANIPNLDITYSSISMPDPSHYKVVMRVANLSSLQPPAISSGQAAPGTNLVWQTMWHVPADPKIDPNGGAVFHVDAESDNGGTPVCYDGQNAFEVNGGGAEMTYPASHAIPPADCVVNQSTNTIAITVPTSDVTEPGALDNTLYSVTASTQIDLAPNANIIAESGVGGQPPSLVDVAPAYNFVPPAATAK